jgi:hypothetical protein
MGFEALSMRTSILARGLVVVLCLVTAAARGQNGAGKVIPLPADDREVLEKYLGKGVIGKPVAAAPIDDPAAYFGLRPGFWQGKKSGGSIKGDTGRFEVARPEDKSDPTWRATRGTNVWYVQQTDAGDVEVTAAIDHDQGVISRFSPSEPRVIKGVKPGESVTRNLGVKVYDLKDLDDVSHKGKLKLTYTYVGAYEVKTPAGEFEAALFRWHYKGKVGPAKVEDTVYRLFAKGVGPVGFVETKNISAMLIYSDKTKIGFVLQDYEHHPKP